MAMSDVERQRKRREKIKNQLKEVKFEPKQFIAYAIRKLYAEGFISEEALQKLKMTAIELIPEYLQDCDNIKIKFITQKIEEFLKNGE